MTKSELRSKKRKMHNKNAEANKNLKPSKKEQDEIPLASAERRKSIEPSKSCNFLEKVYPITHKHQPSFINLFILLW